MLHSLCRLGLTAVLFGLLLAPGLALAQDRRVRHVQDDAHLFSKDAIREANSVIDKIHAIHKKDLFIETVPEGPEKSMMAKWARERYDNAKIDGVYVVFSKKPHHFEIVVGDHTLGKYFTEANITELKNIIKAKQSADEMLNRVASFTLSAMNEHHKTGAEAPRKNAAPLVQAQPPVVRHDAAAHEASMPPWLGWVCMIAAVLFVVWIVFAIIRAITGMMGGGHGYGGGGYGMGGGGYGMGGGGYGGGGFFTGMLGGMFGSMAGMWLYNNMFGGHATYGANGNVNWGGGGDYGNSATGADDTDTGVGASAGGDDYGGGDDNAGGGDAGKDDGGGDWGGKGDDGNAGGGGDAGGGDAGGGDAGGGGGDWGGGGDGGGGGGDWGGGGDAGGGGGGDWGGGGGGGDWGGGGGGGDFGGGGGGGGGDW